MKIKETSYTECESISGQTNIHKPMSNLASPSNMPGSSQAGAPGGNTCRQNFTQKGPRESNPWLAKSTALLKLNVC